jgi:hypothetical protein
MSRPIPWFLLPLEGVSMKRVNIEGFYDLGWAVHPLTELSQDATLSGTFTSLVYGASVLSRLLDNPVVPVRVSANACRLLRDQLRAIVPADLSGVDFGRALTPLEIIGLTNAAKQFETVLGAELQTVDTYYIDQKRGYDTASLIARGRILFPDDLGAKVPEAIGDVEQGCRCIAFELPTAAGFHLHRANESVLHRYYDAVMEGAKRPASRNMGDYIKAIGDGGKGDKRVLSALKDLKDLHRNPLIHPEHSLEDTDEAIALLGSIQGVVVHMLRAIPNPVAPATLAITSPRIE